MSLKIKWQIAPDWHEDWHACLENRENVIQRLDFENMNSTISYWLV